MKPAHLAVAIAAVLHSACSGSEPTIADAAIADAGADVPLGAEVARAADATANMSSDGRPDAAVDQVAAVPGASCQVSFAMANSGLDGGTLPPTMPGTDLPPAITGVFPAPGATGVCPDVQLRLAFAVPAKLGKAGKIRVWQNDGLDAGAPIVADSIDLGEGSYSKKVGGKSFFYWPVVFEGNVATIILHAPLAAGAAYQVTVDDGVFVDGTGAALPGTVAGAWSFRTVDVAPAAKPALTVALDGSGDTCTVQGAIDLVPAGNGDATVITVAPGTYRELVYASGKGNITLRGLDRERTIIGYANNENCNKGTASRALVTIAGGSNWTLENLTVHNQAPLLGANAQAEALHVEAAGKVIVRDANLYSNQDTLLLNGQVYLANCLIKGNVDFIWGTGVAFFDRCEIRTVARAGYNVQARNGAASYGYVFVDSKLTADGPGITGHLLARTNFSDPTGAPACHVAYVNCQMGPHIDPKGWLVATSGVDNSKVRFWEYQSTDLESTPLDVSQRIAVARQLDEATAAQMRDPTVVLGGWNPRP